MTDKLQEANDLVNSAYAELREALSNTIEDFVRPLDELVAELDKDVSLLSNNELWDLQMKISVEAYRLGNIKEQSALKDACANAVYNEKKAEAFSTAAGAVENKKQQAIIDTIQNQAVAMLYEAAANMLKTKCDEAHRLVNTIQNIQISRAAEAKLSGSPRSESDRMLLNE